MTDTATDGEETPLYRQHLFALIEQERAKQCKQWNDCTIADIGKFLRLFTEEFGEALKVYNDGGTWDEFESELIQAIALMFAFLEHDDEELRGRVRRE